MKHVKIRWIANRTDDSDFRDICLFYWQNTPIDRYNETQNIKHHLSIYVYILYYMYLFVPLNI